MEALLLVGVAAFFLLTIGGAEAQPTPKLPKVVYIVAEPERGQAGGGGCLLVFALAVIVLLALALPS